MSERKNNNIISTLILSVTIIISVILLSNAFLNRHKNQWSINVKGMTEREFTSDMSIWKVNITDTYTTRSEGFTSVENQIRTVIRFLKDNGLTDDNIQTESFKYWDDYESIWDNNSSRYISRHIGYKVSQTLTVTCTNVDLIDKLSREITSLVKDGIMINSSEPEYYYTKLADLKLEMLNEAASDARNRAIEIAKSSNSKVGKLKQASSGVFQILGKYSNEDYSWGGTFNTNSKEKVATVTVTATYGLK